MGAVVSDGVLIYGARAAYLLVLVWALFTVLRQLLRSKRTGIIAARGWRYVLARRNIISLDDPSNKDALDSLYKVVTPWEVAAIRGAGIGAMAGIILGSLLALPLFLSPQTFTTDVPWFELAIVAMYILRAVGGRVGAIASQLRAESRIELVPERSTGYNRSLTGRVSDFRASILVILPALCWLLTCAFAVGAAIGLIQPYVAWNILPPRQHPLLFVLPAISALTLITLELLAYRRVKAHQRIFTYQTMISREVNAYIRAVNLGHLYLAQFNIATSALLAQWVILVLLGPPLTGAFSWDLFLAILVISTILLGFVNRSITQNAGRLGGRLTGWWWQQRAAPQANA
jgi:hypothetical protein